MIVAPATAEVQLKCGVVMGNLGDLVKRWLSLAKEHKNPDPCTICKLKDTNCNFCPIAEDKELNHDDPFYICGNCAQLMTKELYEKVKACPNCEFDYQTNWHCYAIGAITALWWFVHKGGWMKTMDDIGINLITNKARKKLWTRLLRSH